MTDLRKHWSLAIPFTKRSWYRKSLTGQNSIRQHLPECQKGAIEEIYTGLQNQDNFPKDSPSVLCFSSTSQTYDHWQHPTFLQWLLGITYRLLLVIWSVIHFMVFWAPSFTKPFIRVWNSSGTQNPHPASTGQSSGCFNTQESTAFLTIFSCLCQAVWGEAVRKCPFPISSPPGTWCRLIAVGVWYPALSQEGVNYLPCATWPALRLGCWHMARHHSSFCSANLQFY